MPRTKLLQGSVSVTFRLPRETQKRLAAKARREKLSLSQLIRRALQGKIQAAGKENRRKER